MENQQEGGNVLFVGVEQQQGEEEFVGRGKKRELGDFVVSIAGE